MNYYHFLSTLWIQMLSIFMHYLILILPTLHTISYYIFPFHSWGWWWGVGRGRWEGGDTVIPLWKHGKWVLFWHGVPHYVLSGR